MANNLPFPYMPLRSTANLFESFDPAVFSKSTKSNLYYFLDALVGTTGAGSLINQIFLANLNGALETTHFHELDYIFGNISFMSRTTAESYTFDPLKDQITTDQWDEVRVKDAWFRARIKDFFQAVQLGCTPEGIRKVVQAAIAADCTIMEVWRYADNFGIRYPLGRSESVNHYAVTDLRNGHQIFFGSLGAANAYRDGQTPTYFYEVEVIRPRNELVIKPHKKTITPEENRLLREMLARLMPVETVVTVDVNGLSVSVPVESSGASSDSNYYEVIKTVTPTPLVSQLPDPEYLPIDLLESEKWLLQVPDPNGVTDPLTRRPKMVPDTTSPREAPTAAFMQSSQYSYYYLVGGGQRSPIDSVTYGTLQSDGTVKKEQNFQVFKQTSTYTDWQRYEKADSPDNFPGGKFGRHPGYEPALNPDGTQYSFPYPSQSAYIAEQITKIEAMGGIADQSRYKLPIQKVQTAVYTYYPDYAVADYPPAKESTVSASITRQRPKRESNSLGNPSNFVR